MTSFVHVDQPAQHPGVERAGAVVQYFQSARGNLNGARGLAGGLLAAIVAAILVVADRMITTLEDGEALVAWTLAVAVFTGLVAVSAGAIRSTWRKAVQAWQRGAERRANARADAQFFASASFDPRVMHELQAAVTRYEAEAQTDAPVAARRKLNGTVPSLYEASRRVRMATYY
jgi:hypothetical protein